MVNLIKNWISSLLCLGIIVAFLQLIIPESKFKKYINSLIGLVMILTVLSPIIKIYKDDELKLSVEEVISTFSSVSGKDSKTTSSNLDINTQNDLVKKNFIEKIKSDINLKLNEKKISVKSVDITMDKSYNITLINISIKKIDTSITSIHTTAEIAKYIETEYDVNISKIKVVESGE